MKAFYATGFGGPEVMRYGDLPDPVPRPGEVRVAVHASSINPGDFKMRGGALRMFPAHRRFPRAFGIDFAGVIDARGDGAVGLAVGDRVYGAWITRTAELSRARQGGHAEYVCERAAGLRRIPPGLDFEAAAALPVGALTALAGLRMAGERAGRRVLVIGATGGVGHFAVQMAKAGGAHVTAVCRGTHAERALALGADAVFDYRATDVAAIGRRFDLVFDAHGGLGWRRGSRLLAPGGAYANTLPSFSLGTRQIWSSILPIGRGYVANLRGLPSDYAELERLLEEGSVKPLVEHVFPLDRAAEAFALAEEGGFVGKIVLKVR